MDKIFYYCTACGEYVYREPGKRHGDGQQDSDTNPVYLLADYDEMIWSERAEAEANPIQCGCTD